MNYFKAIKSNSSALAVTYGSMIFEGAIMTMLIALMTPLSKTMNVTLSEISMMITAQALGTVSVIYIAGNISDKIGRKKIILLGLFSYFLFLMGMYFTTNFYFALFLALLAGVGHGLMDSPSISMLIDIFGNHSGPAMSVVAVFFSGGGAISTFIVREFIKYDIDFRILYVVFIILAFIHAYIVWNAKYPEKQKVVVEKHDYEEIDEVMSSKNHEKIVLTAAILLAVVTFLFASGNSILRTWVSTYSNEIKGMTLEKSIGMLTYLQIGNLLGAIIYAYVLTKVHSTKVMIFNGIMAAIGLSIFLQFSTAEVIVLMLVGSALSVSFSLSLNIIGELYAENSGKATGFIGTASMASGMVMTFLSGILLPIIGVKLLIWLSVVIIAVATFLAIVFRGMFTEIKNHGR